MSRVIRRIAPFAAVCVVIVLALPASSSAASCRLSLSTARDMGPTYVTQLRQTGTSCSNAVRVTRAFHSCRLRKGKRGRCTTTVRGYSCSDRRPADLNVPTQFTGNVICRRGGARITHTYQQNT